MGEPRRGPGVGTSLKFGLAGWAGAAFLQLLGRSLRYSIEGGERVTELRAGGEPIVFCFWHAWILPLAWLHRGEGVVVLISRHGDGEYIARVIRRMGFGTARGSSSRGGVQGARELVRALRGGSDAAITPDGPRGPAGTFKDGALLAARLSSAAIVPVAVDVEPAWRLNSWDRFAIPKPFARVRVRYGEPRRIARDAGEAEVRRVAADLASFLGAASGRRSPGVEA